TPVQYARQSDTAEFRSRFNRYRYPASRYTYMGYNLTKPLFADRRVRQALTMAINKDELVHGVQFGLGRTAHGPFKPDTWADNPQLKDIPYDPQGARRLLAEAGWRPGGDGILHRQGKPFRFTVLTNQGNAERLKGAQIIQQRLREVGIDMQIRQVEWASFMLNFIDTRDFEAVILGWSTTPDPDIFDIWHSSKTGPKELNFIGYKNPEVDRLLEQGRRTFDQSQRQRAYWRIQEMLVTDQPYTFLFVPDSLVAVSRRVRGIKPAPAGIGHNIIQWYVPKSEQLR
ncbi:MAG TPA: ABC transporter substrate-binding protein, partial [Geobacterales bacterium]|nr:ABC transporter substrate-binding protein [Geobacterales bacterium]